LLTQVISSPLSQYVALPAATRLDQAAQNLSVTATVTVCPNAGTGNNLDHLLKLLCRPRLPDDQAVIDERAGTTRAWPLVIPDILWRCLDWQRARDAAIFDGVKRTGCASVFTLVKWCDHRIGHTVRVG
jgi:hypothetical protein